MSASKLRRVESNAVLSAVARWAKIPADRQTPDDLADVCAATIPLIGTSLMRDGVARIALFDGAKDLDPALLERLLTGISSKLGFIVPQSHKANMIAHIQDEGGDYERHSTRGHQTNAALAFHSDRCDLNLILYVRVAERGGDVSVVSYETAAQSLYARDADAYAAMFDGFPFDLREERIFPSIKWQWRPILWRIDSSVRGHYIRRFIADSQRHPDCPRLSAAQVEALDRFDEVLDALRPQRTFAPTAGELLALDNYRVMHARTSFDDCRRDARRLAIRTWVAPFDSERLPTFLHALSGACAAGVFRGGVGSGDEFHSKLGRRRPVEQLE